MKVNYIHEKGTGRLNEDSIVLNCRTFGVFDGATSLNGFTAPQGETGGFLASQIASQAFENQHLSLEERAAIANATIAETMRTYQIDISRKENLWSTSAAAIQIQENELSWLQTGDSEIILIDKNNNYRVLVDRPNHDYETLQKWQRLSEHTRENIYHLLKDQLLSVRKEMNVMYGVLNGEDTYNNLLTSGQQSLEGIAHILLFTDGLKIPEKEISKNNNYDKLVEIFLKKGLRGIRNYVRQLEKSDPDCIVYPRFKTHDDIAAIALSL